MGEFEVLEVPQAEEGIREVYQLAMSLRADFRRVGAGIPSQKINPQVDSGLGNARNLNELKKH